jgi:hypothetical protein
VTRVASGAGFADGDQVIAGGGLLGRTPGAGRSASPPPIAVFSASSKVSFCGTPRAASPFGVR